VPLPLKTENWKFSQPYYDNTAIALGCANATEPLDCLHAVPFADINLYFNKTWNRYFCPQPDNDFIQVSTLDRLVNGTFTRVPILIGTNSDEGTAFAPKGINTDDQMLAAIRS
jgi:carboxylesterase type B